MGKLRNPRLFYFLEAKQLENDSRDRVRAFKVDFKFLKECNS